MKQPKFPKEEVPDCFECRAIGTLTFGGLSGYATYLRYTTPKSNPSQRLFLAFMMVTTGSLAIYRSQQR